MSVNHLLILPLVLPLLSGSTLLIGHAWPQAIKWRIALLSTWALVPLAIGLLWLASDDQLRLYALGNWPAPFGIVLMLDRLAAWMLLATAVLAAWVMTYAGRADSESKPNLQAIYLFQLLGINGAFLTGDLFNLFVFFEILLIASYALLVHGNTGRQIRAGMHYVVLNLLGSALFLVAISLLYGLTGTLNMIDLSIRVTAAPADQGPLLATAGFLLLIVFGLKAAILPLHFWLPAAYASAAGPVAALFSIMTKVGLYAIVRVFTLVFGSAAGSLAHLGQSWLWPLALLTLLMGGISALAARELQKLLACLVLVSVGTLAAGLALGTPQGLSVFLYYLLHSTWVMGGLFLLADLIIHQRGPSGGQLVAAPSVHQPIILGGLFFVGAVSVAGLPPFSGFLGKLMLLQAADMDFWLLWPVVLGVGLVLLIALSRAGSQLFWRTVVGPVRTTLPPNSMADPLRLLACIALLSASIWLVVFAHPILIYVQATVSQLLNLAPYTALVSGANT